nr:Tetracycline resistance protein, class B [Chlamydiota bacterium]
MDRSKKKRLSSLLAAYTILFLDNMGFAVVFPIFPLLFLNHTHSFLPAHTPEATRHLLLGFLIAAFPLAQFFGAPFFGDLGDRFGRKRALFFTIIGTVIGYALSALAIFLSLFTLLLFSRLLTGFFAGNLSLAMAAIADLNVEEKARGKSMSVVAMLLGISWILSILMGASFSNPANSHTFYPALPLLITALLALLSLWVLKRFYNETSPCVPEHRPHILKGLHNIIHIFESKQLRSFYLILFFWVFGTILALQWVAPVTMIKFGATQTKVMWLFLASGTGWALGSGLVNRYLDFLSKSRAPATCLQCRAIIVALWNWAA